MPTIIDCQQVMTVGGQVLTTINELENAASQLSQYMNQLTSAVQGAPMQIPDRFDNWKTVLQGITDEMNQTKVQLQNIVDQAEELYTILTA